MSAYCGKYKDIRTDAKNGEQQYPANQESVKEEPPIGQRHYVGLAERMWEDESFKLSIDYDDLLAENKALAYDIANYYEQVKSSLLAAAKEFLRQQYSVKESDARLTQSLLHDKIQKRIKLDFSWMPNSIISLDDFIKLNPTKTRWLFEGHKYRKHIVAVVSPALRMVTQKMVKHVTSAHREGKGWNGKWEIGDWDVINNSCVHLRKQSVPIVDRAVCIEDLKAIATKVLLKLIHEGTGMIPAFLGHLVLQMQDPDIVKIPEEEFLGWFYEFLQFHPALMSSRARNGLIEGLYYAAVRLNYNKLERYETLFSDTRFTNWNKFVWKKRKTIHDILWEVYWDGFYPDMSTPSTSWILPYENTADHYLQFLRHILQHSNKRSVFCGVVTLTAATEAEMLAADKNRIFLAEFIKMIFQAKRMESELLATWKLYKSTMDYDDE